MKVKVRSVSSGGLKALVGDVKIYLAMSVSVYTIMHHITIVSTHTIQNNISATPVLHLEEINSEIGIRTAVFYPMILTRAQLCGHSD